MKSLLQPLSNRLSYGKRVLVPKTYGQGRMIFVDYDESYLQKSSFWPYGADERRGCGEDGD